jgi:hypothetical protein
MEKCTSPFNIILKQDYLQTGLIVSIIYRLILNHPLLTMPDKKIDSLDIINTKSLW